eukprot:CAMPEP_0182469160 /NCGR_PEP_ID=MMETSP1319-20130603/16639_1 /TAXON_ID=172717 /ORGANISM="Bolidomonas pacifica, Strain RCC208" /LENGTH=99 /DNA_ID=CAMNT_0024669437 /DNA_START=206 /DNA_END=501 /DNA_ORIENTATION=-
MPSPSTSPPPACEDCIPSTSPSGVRGGAVLNNLGRCRSEYDAVAACMLEKEDQVRECQKQWSAFRDCHGGGRGTMGAESENRGEGSAATPKPWWKIWER